MFSPFPEEFNRQAVSIISSYNFAPTEKSKQNLINEGKKESSIYVTGNTAIDALKTTIKDNYIHPELDWARAVSYTHLVFFKLHNLLSKNSMYVRKKFKTIVGDNCSISPLSYISKDNVKIGNNAVSYTHLDVYKRQS